MLVPTGMHELDESHAALGQPPGHQAVVGKRPLPLDFRAVHVQHVLRFLRKIRQLRHAGLHAIGHFILRDARGDLRIAELSQRC